MRTLCVLSLLTLTLLVGNAAATTIAGGNVINQTWTTAGNPYIVQGDITIPAGSTLTIEPGVIVQFAASDSQVAGIDTGKVEVVVAGILDINGTSGSQVQFSGSSAVAGSWYGIVVDTAATTVNIDYLDVSHAQVGITHRATAATITTSNVTLATIGNTGMRIETGSPTYNGVATSGGNYGIDIVGTANATLTNCIARNTNLAGVRFITTSGAHTLSLTNCTINSTGSYGVFTNASTAGTVTITDSIITNASTGVYRNDSSSVSVTYSNVWSNTNNYSSVTAGTGTISSNPLYVSGTNLRLTSNSPSRFGAAGGGDMGALPYVSDATPGLYGVLWANTTLTAAGSPHAVGGDLTAGPGFTLTIQPGATLTFAATDIMESGLDTGRAELVARGSINASGTTNMPITLQGASAVAGSWWGIVVDASATGSALTLANVLVNHPQVGFSHRSPTATVSTSAVTLALVGNTGMRIEAGSPTYNGIATSGGNYGIDIAGTANATLTNCVARNTNLAGVRFITTSGAHSLSLTNCTINATGSYGVFTNASTAGTVTITDSIITNASTGVYRNDSSSVTVTYSNVWSNTNNYSSVTAGTGTISSNPLYVSGTNLRLTANSPSRFGAAGGGDMGALPYVSDATPGLYGVLWTPMTLTAAGSPYTVGGDLTAGPGVTLTIQAGATLSFAATDIMESGLDAGRAELVARGSIVANATQAQPITLQGASAVAGSWWGIVVDPAATGAALSLTNVLVNHPQVGISHRSATATVSTSAVTLALVGNTGMRIEAGSPTYNGVATSGGNYGIDIAGTANATLTNCLVRNTNLAGVRFITTSGAHSLSLTNCTINATGSYGVFTNASTAGTVAIKNSIITNASTGVYRNDSSSVTVTYSDVWNNTNNYSSVVAGTGTISANPQYVSGTDLSLQGSSVAIDVGTATGAPTSDIRGATRPVNGDGINGAEYDMGAYEYSSTAVCGNSVVENGEACDNGASNGMYGFCNSTCTGLGPRCGDNTMNGTEQCDDGNTNDTDACLSTCMNASCGDGFLRAGVEACDDNNASNTDGCVGNCQIATCGDSYVRDGVEACDDGNNLNTDACLTTCVAATCGDTYVRAGMEQCDDANNSNTDACLNSCMSASCGDTYIQSGVEACDDGNTTATDACTGTCQNAVCGDGITRAGTEQCDDANASNTDACVEDCTMAGCGDGYVQAGVEGCDDGNQVNDDGCNNACVSTSCGDGIVQPGVEECDDGNDTETDACRSNCLNARCGDGILEAGVETCEDGNATDGDGCSATCMLEGGVDPDPDPEPEPDAGGCCSTSGGRDTGILGLLAVLLVLRPRRRRVAR